MKLSYPNQPSSTLFTIYIPLNHNDGQHMSEELLRWAQHKILRYTGGMTTFPPGLGWWVGSSKVYHDQILPIQVVTQTGGAQIWFKQLAEEMAIEMKQMQIFLFSQPVSLLGYEPFQFVTATARKSIVTE